MRPSAASSSYQIKRRGILNRVRSVPSPAQVEKIYGAIQGKVALVKTEIDNQRKVSFSSVNLRGWLLYDPLHYAVAEVKGDRRQPAKQSNAAYCDY